MCIIPGQFIYILACNGQCSTVTTSKFDHLFIQTTQARFPSNYYQRQRRKHRPHFAIRVGGKHRQRFTIVVGGKHRIRFLLFPWEVAIDGYTCTTIVLHA